MRTILSSLLVILLLQVTSYSQNKDHVQSRTLGVHFILNDFVSAAKIRASSLSTVFKDQQFGKINEMSPGLALNYMDGLSKHFDLSVTLAGSFLDYQQQNRPATGSDHLLLEADFSVRGKIFSNKYWVSPYVQAGLGAAKYQNYYGAFVPVGLGLQLNFFDEAFLLINTQYRIPVTETSNYHFYYSIGLAGNIGKKE